MRCELCERDVEALTAHHLTPRQATRRRQRDPGPTVPICWACHRQIHSLFSNTELARTHHSIETLRADPRVRAFIAWVQKQDPARHVRVRGKRR